MRTNLFFLRHETIVGRPHSVLAAIEESFDYRPTLVLSALPLGSTLPASLGACFEKDIPTGIDESTVPWAPLEGDI